MRENDVHHCEQCGTRRYAAEMMQNAAGYWFCSVACERRYERRQYLPDWYDGTEHTHRREITR